MKKSVTILLIICGFAFSAYSQRGYYIKDNKIFSGIMLIYDVHSNYNFCQFRTKDGVKRLTPYEVEEYGIKDGDVYQSFEIQIDTKTERFFFQRLLKGRISLYSIDVADGTKKYFITADDSTKLIALPDDKKECDSFFRKYLNDSLAIVKNYASISKNERSLIHLLKNSNKGFIRPIPRKHFGIKLGADATQLSAVDKNSKFGNGDFQKDWNMTVGAFLDIPILQSNFSFSPEINFKSLHTMESFNFLEQNYDLQLDYSSINIPLYFRYSLIRKSLTPYIQAGPLFSRMITNTANLYTYNDVDDIMSEDFSTDPVFPKYRGGYSVGCGFIIDYGAKLGWFGEMRYNQLYNMGQSTKNLNTSDFSFMVGVIF